SCPSQSRLKPAEFWKRMPVILPAFKGKVLPGCPTSRLLREKWADSMEWTSERARRSEAAEKLRFLGGAALQALRLGPRFKNGFSRRVETPSSRLGKGTTFSRAVKPPRTSPRLGA